MREERKEGEKGREGGREERTKSGVEGVTEERDWGGRE